MLKQVVSLVLVFGLYLNPKILFLAQNIGNDSNEPLPKRNLVTKQINYSQPAVNQTTRLEISLSRRRVTLYQGETRIKSYPIAIGREGWETPKGNFYVMQMLKNPTWIHPLTGKAFPSRHPDNPLGGYWIGFWTNGKNWIGFHGTSNPETVGTAASHGCIRMYNQDIQELFRYVGLGTPVKVVR
jgi:lipoprotein-anchoring transpeptidase ErfK/SrfK